MIFLNSFAGLIPEPDPVKTPSLYLISLLLRVCGRLKETVFKAFFFYVIFL
jgi:hypothetical protein